MSLTVDEAARRLRIEPDQLEAWENGSDTPTFAQLKKLAALYGRTPAFFLIDPTQLTRPSRAGVTDFRAVGPAAAAETFEVRRRILTAVDDRSSYLALKTDLPDFAHEFEAAVGADGSLDAEKVRKKLGVSLERQYRARDAYTSLALWISALERFSVLVFHASSLGEASIRGLSLFFERAPVIILRGKDAPAGRLFTLAHELGHLLLRTNAMCDPLHANAEVELRCNRFAAELLMPGEEFRATLTALGRPVDRHAVEDAARRFGVSDFAAAVRALELGMADRDLVDEVRRLTISALREREQAQASGTGFVPAFRIRMRDLGRLYVTTVLDAYERDEIGLTDAVQALRVKVRTLEKMHSALSRPRAGVDTG